ncbi:hypothetical protein PENANT_c004G00137 [Penicillium antarcticum]|uniref:Uncharacterized protein n=1 Tax=Penicillium antarcticum TaxID=416450 RepID=A0A1V6QGQ9_9EURO|nr:uncharacterized protein N7508_002252 [Penicillium antarcticum]KAJ5317744.1 hypothetical protein N7508_002252 [Penicillium antarcticum]OQD88410.1 hypothetical protein PENANT_c004G00137 [Penicillium antarcticum]
MALVGFSHLSRPFTRLAPTVRPVGIGLSRRSIATAAPSHAHPNPGNFANRSHDELSAMGQKGGKKGGKARGVGGFHDMDREKQHAIASKGGRAERKAAIERDEIEHQEGMESKRRSQSQDPSVVPPGFEEWKTCA